MRHWDYRVVRHPDTAEPGGYVYQIHEVFYEHGKPKGLGEHSAPVLAESLEGIATVLDMMRQSLTKGVLDATTLETFTEDVSISLGDDWTVTVPKVHDKKSAFALASLWHHGEMKQYVRIDLGKRIALDRSDPDVTPEIVQRLLDLIVYA